ncbi:MAG: DUF4290 domain-containing protein [Flavobacteriaceae bacterium]|nr:DUF4290 domain-containing protein [Flavobacteriaceae bacterium]MDG0966912.1 DUF4290 domain-containing protein [Flavobacteriaceae bacterium]
MDDTLQYNTQRSPLRIPEYGRHIQKMVDQALDQPDKEERNKMANAIIGVMGNLNPHLRDVPDFQHKLWDQLFIMSDFSLDVDSPYPIPEKEVLAARPDPLSYPQNFPKYRFYGNNIKRMIDAAVTFSDGDQKDALIYVIANHMKKCFLNWNKDTVEDAVIFNHLFEISNGQIDLKKSEETLTNSDELIRLSNKRFGRQKPHQNNKNNKHKKYRSKRLK